MYTFEEVCRKLGRRESTITKYLYSDEFITQGATCFDGYKVRITAKGYGMLEAVLGTKDNKKSLR